MITVTSEDAAVCKGSSSSHTCDKKSNVGFQMEPKRRERSRVSECLRSELTPCNSRRNLVHTLLGFLPVIAHLRSYRWKSWLPHDILAGLSAGVIHIPQGMGFALLAGLPPAYGLYTSIFPGLLYYIFGTSRHLSFGTMALTALMVGTAVNREYPLLPIPQNSTTEDFQLPITPQIVNQNTSDSFGVFHENGTRTGMSDEAMVARKVSIAVSVTLIAGLFQLLMRVCRLGMLTTYMSMPFVGSFMAGSALQIIVSQLPFQLGIKIRRPPDTFQLPLTLYQVFSNIEKANVYAVVTSIICIAFLVGIKEGVNEPCKARMRMPVPVELILVVVATPISHFARLNERFSLPVIGAIPTGFPSPAVPSMPNFGNYVADGIVMAIIGFAVAISMAQLMAQRHRYEINTNQEVLAYGIVNTVGPFFGCFMSTQAPPRTMVHEATGCKTQMAGCISVILPLLVVLAIGPLFESLPTSVLGCIVSCSLVALLKQFADLLFIWRVNRFDFVVWMGTFLTTSFLSVTIGLIIGIALNIFVIVLHSQLAKGYRTIPTNDTEIHYRPTSGDCSGDLSSGEKDKEFLIPDINVFRFDCGEICFANADSFKRQLFLKTVDPIRKLSDMERMPDQTLNLVSTASHPFEGIKENIICDLGNKIISSNGADPVDKPDPGTQQRQTPSLNGKTVEQDVETTLDKQSSSTAEDADLATDREFITCRSNVRLIVLDCSSVSYVDITGLSVIKQIAGDFRSADIRFVLAGCNKELRRKLTVFGMISPSAANDLRSPPAAADTTDKKYVEIYPTVHDAVVASRHQETIV